MLIFGEIGEIGEIPTDLLQDWYVTAFNKLVAMCKRLQYSCVYVTALVAMC